MDLDVIHMPSFLGLKTEMDKERKRGKNQRDWEGQRKKETERATDRENRKMHKDREIGREIERKYDM